MRPWSDGGGNASARSGTSRLPSGPAAWSSVTSPSLIRPRNCDGTRLFELPAAGSMVSIFAYEVMLVRVPPR